MFPKEEIPKNLFGKDTGDWIVSIKDLQGTMDSSQDPFMLGETNHVALRIITSGRLFPKLQYHCREVYQSV